MRYCIETIKVTTDKETDEVRTVRTEKEFYGDYETAREFFEMDVKIYERATGAQYIAFSVNIQLYRVDNRFNRNIIFDNYYRVY